MGRDSFREGCDDYSRGFKVDSKYNDEFSSYREGWDTQEEEYPVCGRCGEEEAEPGTDPPRCTGCMQESSECPPPNHAANYNKEEE